MADCSIPCTGGSLSAAEVSQRLQGCEHDTLTIKACRVDAAADALRPLRAMAYPDMRLSFDAVTGAIDLHGAQLRDVVVLGSNLDAIDLHDATVDRVRIAPSTDPMPDAYASDARAPKNPIEVKTVVARGCHARSFALLAAKVGGAVDLKHVRVDDTLDLTFTLADSVSMRFGDVLRLEAARLTTTQDLDMFGARTSQASLAWANLGALNTETGSI